MDLSIIIPLYNEEDSLADLYNQLLAVLNTLQLNYEISQNAEFRSTNFFIHD